MTRSLEYEPDQRLSASNVDAADQSREQAGKQAGRLAATMQLIRKNQQEKRFNESDALNKHHHQLSLLLDDLAGVIDDIGDEGQYFDFHLANGSFPQLWIDNTTCVEMAKGGEGFRLLKETRAGRVLLRESRGRDAMGEAVVHYIAERLSHIENDRMQAKHVASGHDNRAPENKVQDKSDTHNAMMESEPRVIVRRSRLRSFVWFLIGFSTGVLTLLALAWFRNDISAYLSAV